MTQYATPPFRLRQGVTLMRLPSEILRNIFRSLFEEAVIDLKRPHDLNQQKLLETFPILAVDERLLSEGIHVLLRHATLEIEDLTNFPRSGPALLMLQKIRKLALQKSQLATFGLSRQFPQNALRSSRNSFKNLQKIDINVWSSLSDMGMNILPGSEKVPLLVQSAWNPPTDLEEFDLCYAHEGNELVEFLNEFQRKYTIVLRMEFWVGGRLRCEAGMSKGIVTEIVVENKGQWWNEDLWRKTLIDCWNYSLTLSSGKQLPVDQARRP